MQKDSRYFWYIVDIIVFLAINLILIHYVTFSYEEVLQQISWTNIILLALGIWRLTDVITHENVTEPFRALFKDKKVVNGKETWVESEKGFKGFAAALLSCNACMGVWVSMIVFYSYIFYPIPTLVFMIIMTLTCLERFISMIYNFLEKRG